MTALPAFERRVKLIEELRSEHVLIEQVVGALQTYAAGAALATDLAAFQSFFHLFADRFHHAREEGVLFPAIVSTEVPAGTGPLRVLTDDHEKLRALAGGLGACPRAELPALAAKYGEALLHHIDAEESVLFPEALERFQRCSTQVPEGRAPDAEELAARAQGERLVLAYPPRELPIIRGEGCVCCPAYGAGCDGIEREWWSELQWEDTLDRMSSG